jgi:hypothetical protein
MIHSETYRQQQISKITACRLSSCGVLAPPKVFTRPVSPLLFFILYYYYPAAPICVDEKNGLLRFSDVQQFCFETSLESWKRGQFAESLMQEQGCAETQ